MLTPRAVAVASQSAKPGARRTPGTRGVLPSAVYVAYRRRSPSGAIRVATGLAGRQGR